MSSFGARAALVLMRGARSGGLVLIGFNAWPPCKCKDNYDKIDSIAVQDFIMIIALAISSNCRRCVFVHTF